MINDNRECDCYVRHLDAQSTTIQAQTKSAHKLAERCTLCDSAITVAIRYPSPAV